MSYDRIRTNINKNYTDEFFEKLPEYFPDGLRRARLRDKDRNLTIQGLARIGKKPEAVVIEDSVEA
jgi:hypothetical protein